jgi:hypothetical protein
MKEPMSKETVVRLHEAAVFKVPGLEKKIYKSDIIERGVNDIQVLSTNHLEGKPVVRLSTATNLEHLDIRFELEGQIIDSALPVVVAPDIVEYILTTAEVRQQEEDAAYGEYNNEKAEKSRKMAKIKPAQEGKAWKAHDQRVTTDDLELAPVTDQERTLAPEATDLQIEVAKIARYTYQGQLKSDDIQLEVFSPFGNVADTQLSFATSFRYDVRSGKTKMQPAGSLKRLTLKKGEVTDPSQVVTLKDNLPDEARGKYELVLTVTDVITGRQVERVFTSQEIGDAQIVEAKEKEAEVRSTGQEFDGKH